MNNLPNGPSRPGDLAAPFLTIKEFAAREKISVRQAHRLIKAGKLPVHRVGRLVRISVRDIALFEAQCRESL